MYKGFYVSMISVMTYQKQDGRRCHRLRYQKLMHQNRHYSAPSWMLLLFIREADEMF